MILKPVEGSLETKDLEVHDQVDGPTAAMALFPVEELHAGDREDPLGGMPLGVVVAVGLGSDGPQYGVQGDGPQSIGTLSNRVETHGHGLSLGLRLTQFFMLMTWLFSVSRSMSAAVR